MDSDSSPNSPLPQPHYDKRRKTGKDTASRDYIESDETEAETPLENTSRKKMKSMMRKVELGDSKAKRKKRDKA